jgi:hypothetical protein
MTDEHRPGRDPTPREMGHQAVELLEKRLASVQQYISLNTEQLGDFWLGLTEACTLRLVRLHPEMVQHVEVEVEDGE